MLTRSGNKTLIEVAAQHPLVDGLYPNEEFAKRLDKAIELYNIELKNNTEVGFYVTGSLHMYNGVSDKISLSVAGKSYLIEKGISKEIIRGTDINNKYMGQFGCYNSADECYVATQYFIDNYFSKLISVCSPAQMYIQILFYIQFGVYQMNYSVPTEKSFHNYVKEMFCEIPCVLLKDHTWQGLKSIYAVDLRKERNPSWKDED